MKAHCKNSFYPFKKQTLYSFDAEEVFQHIETPLCIKNSDSSDLGVLNDCICIYMEFASIEILVMSKNDNRKSWTTKFVFDYDWIWSKKRVYTLLNIWKAKNCNATHSFQSRML